MILTLPDRSGLKPAFWHAHLEGVIDDCGGVPQDSTPEGTNHEAATTLSPVLRTCSVALRALITRLELFRIAPQTL